MNIFKLSAVCVLFLVHYETFSQTLVLQPGKSFEKKLLKDEQHFYSIKLLKGEYVECRIVQKGVDLAIDLSDEKGNKIKTFDSPNGQNGPEEVSFVAFKTGNYLFNIYPIMEPSIPDSLKVKWAEENQGDYTLMGITKYSVGEYKQLQAKLAKDESDFTNWISVNANSITSIDAVDSFDDLKPFKSILKNVRVVGLGESSHGTSEFFRMKHRMLAFLVKEMGYTSFYIEASMSRCRYINDYVLYGKGNLDTATTIQGFVTWRVEEFRNMIEWLKLYNETVSSGKKVNFYGYDMQKNNMAWEGLTSFYTLVNNTKVSTLDSLKSKCDTAAAWSNNLIKQKDGENLFKTIYEQSITYLNDMVLNSGQYQYIVGKDMFEENLINLKLIIQEIESYKDGYNNLRDYYMAENIFQLLKQENSDTKVVVWAHNGHINKTTETMGGYLEKQLQKKYYAIGFEFYSGSYQTRNLDTENKSANWDIMNAGNPPEKSFPSYLNKTGKDKFFIDFRYTKPDTVVNYSKEYGMHSFGSMNSSKWPDTYPISLKDFDGIIFIKNSTAAKNFTKVYLR